MIGSFFFICNRLVEIIFLIPIIGMLVRFTHISDDPTVMSLDSNVRNRLILSMGISKPT
jgi:hypothetical protein